MRLKNLIGSKYNKLTIISKGDIRKGHRYWTCECDCGNITLVNTNSLRSGSVKSCGCSRIKCGSLDYKTGKIKKLYRVWSSMKERCLRKNHHAYKDYGERGITVCDNWIVNYKNFEMWALNNGYKEGLSIDRIDNNGNYNPENCRWSTHKDQQNNRRLTVRIKYNNIEKSINEWAEYLKVPVGRLRYRLNSGWEIKDVLFLPKYKRST